MLYRSVGTSLLCGLLWMTAAAFGQTDDLAKKTPHFYRLDFVVKEVDEGKVINSRAYTLMASTEQGNTASVRTGSKIAVQTAPGQYSYQDAGINLDCRRLSEAGSNLSLTVIADVSSIPEGLGPENRNTIRQNRWDSTLTLPLRKATTIFSSDDVTSKRKMQVELTATPVLP